jgi:hypothetical protein
MRTKKKGKTATRPNSSERSAARKTSARKAQSLHIGLNSVSPTHYQGWSGDLFACEFDEKDMSDIAALRGMSSVVLLTKDATRDAATFLTEKPFQV